MVLSNLNNNMDVESRTMATMGDTLGGSVQTGGRGVGYGDGTQCVGWKGPDSHAPGITAAGCSPSLISGEPCDRDVVPVSPQPRKASWMLHTSATSWPKWDLGFIPRKPQNSS